jgi:hypothetical protein
MRRRAGLGVASAKIDERWPVLRRGGRDASEQADEILLRKTL